MPRTPNAKAIINGMAHLAAEGAALQIFGNGACQALESLAEPSPWDENPERPHTTQEENISMALELCALADEVRDRRVALTKKLSSFLIQRASDVAAGKWPPEGKTATNGADVAPNAWTATPTPLATAPSIADLPTG
jgi:hypothetical protein